MNRRTFITRLMAAGAGLMNTPLWAHRGCASAAASASTLLTAPIEMTGPWNGSLPSSAQTVVSRMRAACLSGVPLLSDHQPDRLRVEDATDGPPHLWLHEQNPDLGWVVVDIGARAWCQLSYQFGHELGHVLCNSWTWKTELPPPCRWLEETLVEAFSIRGLGLLADRWETDPPFTGDNDYAAAIRSYRQNLIDTYRKQTSETSYSDMPGWFRGNRSVLSEAQGLGLCEGPAIVAVLKELEANPHSIEDLGAINRWPKRSGVRLDDYLKLWQASCHGLGSPGRLPVRIHEILGI